MTAQDDPEQRIRDLERPLSERVRELGTDNPPPTYIPPRDPYPPPPLPPAPGAYGGYGGYAPGYPQPPVAFGTPFERQSPSAFRFGWLLVAIPVLGIVIGAVSVMVFFHAADDVSSEFGALQSDSPSMVFPVPATDSAQRAQTAAEGDTVSVSGVSTRRTVVCDGGSVNVSGVQNTVEITGRCANVTVSGVQNGVVVESADAISASGSTNRVRYRSGTPRTSATGDNLIAPA